MPDPKLRWFHSTERKSVYVEGQNFVPDAEGYVAVPENLGSYIMVIPGFTYVGSDRPEGYKPEQPSFDLACSTTARTLSFLKFWWPTTAAVQNQILFTIYQK
jgi:hypothetical protein